jgi:hypothetical protein
MDLNLITTTNTIKNLCHLHQHAETAHLLNKFSILVTLYTS